jgi:hypothetical protein
LVGLAHSNPLYSHATLDLHIASGNWRQASRLKMACVHIYFIFTSRIASQSGRYIEMPSRTSHQEKSKRSILGVAAAAQKDILCSYNE